MLHRARITILYIGSALSARQKVTSSSQEGCSYMLAALRATQDLLQPGGLLETYFSLNAKSSYRLFKKRQNVISSSPTGLLLHVNSPSGRSSSFAARWAAWDLFMPKGKKNHKLVSLFICYNRPNRPKCPFAAERNDFGLMAKCVGDMSYTGLVSTRWTHHQHEYFISKPC